MFKKVTTQHLVCWVVVVCSVGCTVNIPPTQYIRMYKILPSGSLQVSRVVETGIECSYICQYVGCKAFTLEDDTATVGQYLCSAYSLLTSAVQVDLDHPKRVYAAEQDVPYVESLVPTTPRTDVVELEIFENIEGKKEKCPNNKAIGGLVLATGDNTRNTIHYFECRRYKYIKKMELDDPLVEVPTEEEKGNLSCPTDSVLMGFVAWNAQNEEIEIWNHPHKMIGQCKVLKIWSVDHGECQEMPVTDEPWWGAEDDDSSNWNNIIYCPRDSLAVALTRRLVDGYYRVVSLRCCYVSHP